MAVANARRAGPFVVGAVAGGALWGALEVAGFVGKALLPEGVLGQQLLPPRDVAGFSAVALATYAVLGGIGGCIAAPILRRFLAGGSAAAALAAGTALAWWGLACVAVVVWTSMLLDGPLITARSLSVFALGAVGTGAVAAGLLWLPLRRLRSAAVALLLAAFVAPSALLAVAWGLHSRVDFPPVPARGEPRSGLPNIVFVTIDTLRADEVGAYSSGPVRTPTLDRLAAEGVLFERAICHVPTTTPSHVSIFTSLYPFEHEAENGVPVQPDLSTLAGALRRKGYHTAAFSAAYTTKSNVTGLGPAFDVYVDSLHPDLDFLSNGTVEPLVFWRLIGRMSGNQLDASVINRRVRDWLEAGPPEPFFAWIHYFDPHRPYAPPPKWRKRYEPADDSRRERELALYRGEVSYADHRLGRVLEQFEARGLLKDSIVVVTSDHGQGFGEPHPKYVDWSHGRYLYDSVLWVPLIFWAPERIVEGRRVEEQVESIDIAPTLLSLLGEEPPKEFEGRSFERSLRSGAGSSERTMAFSENSELYRPRRMSVRMPDWKLIVSPKTGEEELYHLAPDPGETQNVVEEHPDVAQRLREKLHGVVGTARTESAAPQMDRETLERLEALGYVPDEGEE